MIYTNEYTELVDYAKQGDEQARNRLAELVHDPLRTYVFRRMLQKDISEDIVQESILEMFQILNDLKKSNSFWPWLCKIALNRIRGHQRTEKLHRDILANKVGGNGSFSNHQEELSNLVTREIKQAVLDSMAHLKLKYREVLTMRCYEEKDYDQIADELGCSELNARVLFYRAKKELQKQLSRRGLSKSALISALIIFGKMTAPSKAAAAQIAVTPSVLNVGATAGLFGMLTGKAILVSLISTGIITTGSLITLPHIIKPVSQSNTWKNSPQQLSSPLTSALSDSSAAEIWYYYPQGINGPVMLRHLNTQKTTGRAYCQWLQNDQANYFYDDSRHTVFLNNYRIWQKDLSVAILPTDSNVLCDFISQVEGRPIRTDAVLSRNKGLLIINRLNDYESGNFIHIPQHYNLLEEEFSQFNWPDDIRRVDLRDEMHWQGWCYFTIKGRLNNQQVQGTGQLPFTVQAIHDKPAWLEIQVGQDAKILDAPQGAKIIKTNKSVSGYRYGCFFQGLSRPWMGLHTIDSIRRDAAQNRVWFETRPQQDNSLVDVILSENQNRLVYTVDLHKDLIKSIVFEMSGEIRGEWVFTYYAQLPTGVTIQQPSAVRSAVSVNQEPGIKWLFELMGGLVD